MKQYSLTSNWISVDVSLLPCQSQTIERLVLLEVGPRSFLFETMNENISSQIWI